MFEKAAPYFELAAQVQPQEVKWHLMVASCFRRTSNRQQVSMLKSNALMCLLSIAHEISCVRCSHTTSVVPGHAWIDEQHMWSGLHCPVLLRTCFSLCLNMPNCRTVHCSQVRILKSPGGKPSGMGLIETCIGCLQALAKYKQIHSSQPLNVECLRYLVHICSELGTSAHVLRLCMERFDMIASLI